MADVGNAQFEREKWERECGFKDREQKRADEELALKRIELARSRWANPLAVAIFVAAVAGIGNAWVEAIKAKNAIRADTAHAEAGMIAEAVKEPNQSDRLEKLTFLIKTNLVSDQKLADGVKWFLYDNQKTNLGVIRRDLPTSWIDWKGQLKWPPFDGCSGSPEVKTLAAGTLIDRFGSELGNFFNSKGERFTKRSLPFSCSQMAYAVYKVIKPITVMACKAAPWFSEQGGAIQYWSDQNARALKEDGVIEPVAQGTPPCGG